MKRAAAPLLALLCACDPELRTPHAWACSYVAKDKDAACTGDWYCARDNFCHDPAVGESVPCQKSTVLADCSPGWFCALDSVCHDADAGVQLLCEGEGDCGGGWHCGVQGHCYDRGAAGAVDCRADAGDCADAWRCGVDAVCHPDVDAGAIACRYGVDSDCTDGWRCGAQGRCTDPAGEQLVLGGAMPEAAVPLAVGGPGGVPLFVGPLHADSSQGAAIALDAVTVVHWQKTPIPGQALSWTQTPMAVPGIAPTQPVVVDEGVGFGFDVMSGALTRWAFDDGGTASKVPLNVGHPIDSLRLLPLGPSTAGEAAAFQSGGDGVFLTGAGGQWVPLPLAGASLVDVQGLPLRMDGQPACWLGAQRKSGTTTWSVFRGGSQVMCPGLPQTTAPVAAGDLRVGADGLVANVRRAIDGSVEALEVYDFAPVSVACPFMPAAPGCWSRSIACPHFCNQGELFDFNPVRTPSGLGAEVGCRDASGGPVRWFQLSESALQSGACTASALSEVSLAFEQVLGPVSSTAGTFPVVAPGGLNRFAFRPGSTYDLYGGTGLGFAEPWFMDRPVTFAANVPPGFIVGNRSLFGSIDPLLAVRRPPPGEALIIGRVPRSPLLLTTERVIIRPVDAMGNMAFVGLVAAPDTDWVEPLSSALVPRVQGDSLIVVSAHDSLYAAPLPQPDGGPADLQSVLAPSPGSTILSLSRGLDAADAGLQTSLWVGTRDNVLHTYQTLSGRWRAQVLPIELPDTLVDVWSTRDGRGRVGVANGQVLSLPSGLLLAPSPSGLIGRAQHFLELCDVPFMMDERYVYALKAGPSGPQWTVVLDASMKVLSGGTLFDGTELHVDSSSSNPELTVFGRYGDTWRIKLDGCGP